MTGGGLDLFKGKHVLDAGCGAGRFTEVLLGSGATVFAADLSDAVEANFDAHSASDRFFVCQADIGNLPVSPESFDAVVCIGVIQHTPDPEETMTALCSYLKPGGLLVMDHYTYGYPTTFSRRILRFILLQAPPWFSLFFCQALTWVLWPIHRILWKYKDRVFLRLPIRWLRSHFLRVSPLVDYQEAYPQLSPSLQREWAILDTHDTLTDVYKHLRSAEEIKSCLHQCGVLDVEVTYAGNGVEARARKPLGSLSF